MFTYMHGLIHKWFYLAVFSSKELEALHCNRTSEILDLVPADSWRYVPTKMNPADIACRGLSPKNFLDVVYGGRALSGSLWNGLLA
ncbi:hypothetical protein TNCT_65031 [Trichonephila clavata]|uniref:Uncharacterized protein n=1 Tax=Trichonephila clavata TaxID=2740835 RepID=A0A8X6LII5_TRICU|nr:hypothetical protein TNCT_65031 [Trichonephila clavata]